LGQLSNQAFNVEQTNFATQSMKDTVQTVSAMKTASQALKKEMKNISIDEVEVCVRVCGLWFTGNRLLNRKNVSQLLFFPFFCRICKMI
jgi:hypothetical protein